MNNNRTCPWKLDNGEICQSPAKNENHRMGLCELHSSVHYMASLASQGRLLKELGLTDHSPGFTFLALDSEGNYRLGQASTWDHLLGRLKKGFGTGELTKVVALYDGGKTRHLVLTVDLAEHQLQGVNNAYAPTMNLPEIPTSNRFSELPGSYTGVNSDWWF